MDGQGAGRSDAVKKKQNRRLTMRILFILAAALGLGLVVRASAADAKALAGSHADKLLGTWVIVSGEADGKPSPPDKIKGSQMTVDKKTIKLTDKDDKQLWILDYKLDASKKPAEIDMTVAEGQGAGKSSQGIYELDGDTLKICYGLPGANRPKDFKTKEGAKENCFILKRAEVKTTK
jgi:uncharacterized protein (TIGR03067 family)